MSHRPYDPMPNPSSVLGIEDSGDLRARVQREQDSYHAERRASIAEQSSPLRTPEQRIQLWERLHSLRLPKEANHKLVAVIAAATELSIAEVQSEQQRRATLAQQNR